MEYFDKEYIKQNKFFYIGASPPGISNKNNGQEGINAGYK